MSKVWARLLGHLLKRTGALHNLNLAIQILEPDDSLIPWEDNNATEAQP